MIDLLEIKKPVQQIANAISTVLKVDVEVINLEYLRVAGTGKYAEGIGQKIINNLVYRQVIVNKLDVLITNPREHEFCNPCPEKAYCEECAELCSPVMLKDDVIGVFGLVAFDDEQRKILISQASELLPFIKQMGQMIVSTINEQAYIQQLWVAREQLLVIMNSVNEGILAIDGLGIVTHANDSAAKLMRLNKEQIIKHPVIEVLPGSPMLEVLRTGKEYVNREIDYPEVNLRFLSTTLPIVTQHQIIGAVATFRPIEEVKQLILDYTERRIDVSVNTIIGKSKVIEDLRQKVIRFANSNSTILIRGESGTGKELIARAIHSASPRKEQPFIALNCSAIPDALLESELFGYEEGAFTGAKKRGKPGKFEIADGGTIFLDEIGDMPIHLQAKILRTLQERVIERVGSNRSIRIDVRIIAATNRPLESMITLNEFREDLYYRLNVIPLNITPLRKRKEDILPLLAHFTAKYNKLFKKSVKGFSNQALDILINYHWPGNIRELENVIEYAFNIENSDLIQEESLPLKIRESEHKFGDALKTLKEVERVSIKNALNQFGDSVEGKKNAASALGIGIATLYRKIKDYQL